MATTKHAAMPSLMKAVRIAQYGGSEQLKYEEAPLPQIAPSQVLAKVRYACLNPIDWKIREGSLKEARPASFPLTLGQDFAGEIVIGDGDSGHFRTGERVFGFGEGTYAEFTAAAITYIAAIPEKVESATAAALPTPGVTATRSFAIVKKGGVMVSTVHAANPELAAQAGIRGVNVVIKRSAADLSELAALVERGAVKPRMGEVFRLEEAREAQDTSQQGRAKGKILLKVA